MIFFDVIVVMKHIMFVLIVKIAQYNSIKHHMGIIFHRRFIRNHSRRYDLVADTLDISHFVELHAMPGSVYCRQISKNVVGNLFPKARQENKLGWFPQKNGCGKRNWPALVCDLMAPTSLALLRGGNGGAFVAEQRSRLLSAQRFVRRVLSSIRNNRPAQNNRSSSGGSTPIGAPSSDLYSVFSHEDSYASRLTKFRQTWKDENFPQGEPSRKYALSTILHSTEYGHNAYVWGGSDGGGNGEFDFRRVQQCLSRDGVVHIKYGMRDVSLPEMHCPLEIRMRSLCIDGNPEVVRAIVENVERFSGEWDGGYCDRRKERRRAFLLQLAGKLRQRFVQADANVLAEVEDHASSGRARMNIEKFVGSRECLSDKDIVLEKQYSKQIEECQRNRLKKFRTKCNVSERRRPATPPTVPPPTKSAQWRYRRPVKTGDDVRVCICHVVRLCILTVCNPGRS